jgi:hypothetical protein
LNKKQKSSKKKYSKKTEKLLPINGMKLIDTFVVVLPIAVGFLLYRTLSRLFSPRAYLAIATEINSLFPQIVSKFKI